MFKKMTVIVDRGLAEDVIDVAKECGVTGGTIVHGRGTGTREEEKLFGFEIEPEKELVIMLIPSTLVSLVTETLTKTFHFNTPNKGILYLEPVLETRGLFEAPEQ
ncbi:MAG: P-II family nitrogen regulator [Sphaerochaetaceae bacterium]